MNIKIVVAFLIILSFLNIGAFSNNLLQEKDSYVFENLEIDMNKISKFEENGVKLQYRTKNDILNESNRIKEIMDKKTNITLLKNKNNEIQGFDKDFSINIKIWNQNKYSYVEIILLNRNPKYRTNYLKNTLKAIEDKNMENIQYLLCYKGKNENSDDYLKKQLLEKKYITNIKFLNIDNGYTAVGYLNHGERLNLSLIKYNTGSHIIIGTPIIFTTY